MSRRFGWRREGMTGVLLLAAVGVAGAQEGKGETLVVKGLRIDPLPLYECAGEMKVPKGELSRAKFQQQGPLPAQQDPGKRSVLRVQVGGQWYCVKAFMVETDRTVPATKEGRTECQARVAGKEPRTGATRGMGECK